VLPDSTNDQTDETSTQQNQSENILSQTTSSASSSRTGSVSRPKSPTSISSNVSKESSDQPQPSCPGIRTRSITEDKSNQDNIKDSKRDRSDSQKQLETDSTEKPVPVSKVEVNILFEEFFDLLSCFFVLCSCARSNCDNDVSKILLGKKTSNLFHSSIFFFAILIKNLLGLEFFSQSPFVDDSSEFLPFSF
jgi:hypothetical protein